MWESDTIDRVYEASVIPECWPDVFQRISTATGTDGGGMFAFEGSDARFVFSEGMRPVVEAFINGGWASRNRRLERVMASNYAGFVSDLDLFSEEEMLADPYYTEFLYRNGGGCGAGSIVQTPSGQTIVFNFERRRELGHITRTELAVLDTLRSHLARSAILASRLQLAQARSAAHLLGKIGLPAAVVNGEKKVVATNDAFESLGKQIIALAHGKFAIVSPAANAIMQESLDNAFQALHAGVRSIPIPARDECAATVAHIVPIQRSATDIFSNSLAIIIMTSLDSSQGPSVDLLHVLFDLTPAEAALARRLMQGETLRSIAGSRGVSFDTLRTQLKSVFSKTGAHRQASLVKLLSGISPRLTM
jgi:DNA-binding CsgD family transcriptional regulator